MTSKRLTRRGGIATMLAIAAIMSGCDWTVEPTPVLPLDPTRAAIRSRAVLMAALADEDPITRTNALEAVSNTIGEEAGAHFIEALDDSEPMVQFAAAMVIGDRQYAPAKERLEQLMANPQTDPVTQCALIYALHQLGETRYNQRLGAFLHDPDKTLRANVVMVMGKIGHPSAIEPIKAIWADEKDLGVEVGIVESLATLGDGVAAQQLEGFCRMQRMVSVQLPAIRAVARLAPPDVDRILLDRLQKDPSPRVKVAAAGGLARVGVDEEDGYALCINALRHPKELLAEAYPDIEIPQAYINSLRQLACISLGWYGRTEAVTHLYPMLDDPDGPVRIAAAMSILRLFEDYEPEAPDVETNGAGDGEGETDPPADDDGDEPNQLS